MNAPILASTILATTDQPYPSRARPWLEIKTYTLVGLALLVLFFLQQGFNLKPLWLAQWQQQEWYRQFSGIVLLAYLLLQWRLGKTKIQNWVGSVARIVHIHKWQGALTPLVFYAHSMQLGYAYQLLLSSVFLGNIVVGMLNPEVVRVAHKAYRPSWLVIHIVLAVLTMLLVVFHLYVVYGYS